MIIKNKLLISGLILSSGLFIIPFGISSTVQNNSLVLNDASTTTLTEAPKTLQELRNADPNKIAKLSKFDSRTYDIVTNAKKQYWNTCWTFAIAGASETSILRSGIYGNQYNKNNLDINEDMIDYVTHIRTKDDDQLGLTLYDTFRNQLHQGEYMNIASSMLMNRMGPVSESTTIGSNYEPVAFLKNAIFIDPTDINAIKKAIVEYGAVTVSYYSGGQQWRQYYNANGSQTGPHAVSIVGWDDTISKDKFENKMPSKNGGWICKDSRGNYEPMEGFFYLSYDSPIRETTAFSYGQTKDYQNSYFWDGSSIVDSKFQQKKAAAIFPVKKATNNTKEFVKAVGFGLSGGKNIEVKVSLYRNVSANQTNPWDKINNPTSGELVETQTQTFEQPGFYTIDLNKQTEVMNGEYFSVVVEIVKSDGDSNLLFSIEHNSYNDMTYYYDGSWKNSNDNVNDYVAKIRAITTTQQLDNQNLESNLKYSNLELELNQYYSNTIYRYGQINKPEVIVKFNDEILVKDVDYSVSYDQTFNDVINNDSNDEVIGYGKITVEGLGKYSGHQEIGYPIKIGLRPDLKNFKTQENGNANPKVLMTIDATYSTYKSVPLPSNWEWAFPDKNISLGENTGNYIKYVGSDVKCYRNDMFDVILTKTNSTETIKNIEMAKVTVDSSSDFTYDGKAKVPVVMVNYGGTPLIKDVDYTISYRNNINAGTAEVVVTGIGNYVNEQVVNFQIKKAPNSIKVEFDQSTDKYNVTTTNGKVYYKYFSNEQCTQQLNKQPTTQGTYWVKAYVNGTSNYLPVESKPFKYVISSTSIPTLPDVEVNGNKPSDDIISIKPESPTSSNSSTNANNNQNLVIILATVISSIVVISSLGIGLYLNKKRKNKKNS
ncbi:lectin like domain-containing protein [Mycoplasmoides alvi]|uniref:lectin like domain-containing protein n=1 Tax=Mycoplasmoides alvi TaxID=78580 RepID=UPI00051BB1DF|nr:lectin like domain-containing protein [Mycoplasmoides alvi]